MILLALDQATRFGYCAGALGAAADGLSWGSGQLEGKTGEVLGRWRFWLDSKIRLVKPDRVIFESPYVPRNAPMNALTLRRLMALAGYIEEICYTNRIECRETTSAEASKFLLNRTRFGGRAAKKAATVEAIRAFGFAVHQDDDAADAIAIWLLAEATIAPEIALRRGAGPLRLTA